MASNATYSFRYSGVDLVSRIVANLESRLKMAEQSGHLVLQLSDPILQTTNARRSSLQQLYNRLSELQRILFPSSTFETPPENQAEVLRDALSRCLLIPFASTIPEAVIPGITSCLLSSYLLKTPSVPYGSDSVALLFILCVRLRHHPSISSELQTFTASIETRQSVLKCLQRWSTTFRNHLQSVPSVNAFNFGRHLAFLLQALSTSLKQV